MINLSFIDDQYPFNGVDHTRNVARAILIDENKKVCILKIQGQDSFGFRDYYETPGGGVEKGETFEEAIVREIDEEVCVKCQVIRLIGQVKDYYNLVKRRNINRYFLCRVISKTKIHHISHGDSFIKSIDFLEIDEVINLFTKMKDSGASKLVKQRELPIILEAKKIIAKM